MNKVGKYRRSQYIGIEELAALAGMSAEAVAEIENGSESSPAERKRLSAGLGVPQLLVFPNDCGRLNRLQPPAASP